ncbi:MAG: hypothetical protein AMJ81_10600 [Phycisphaerae bacterium SM23_33]|jgi:hypothetical protein|nr:MAG: hypothetical protein AMJ81_10600 [Phycisphaerae bacterium SM23_33]
MKTRTVLVVVIVGLALSAGGCTRGIKEAAGLFTGAKGSLTVLEPISADSQARPLGAYQRFELAEFADDMNGKAPKDLFRLLPGAFDVALAGKKIPSAASGKTLLIRGKVLHYEDSSAVGMALGPLEFAVARAEFVDKDSGRVLGAANCVGVTSESVNVGVAKKAEGLAKAIVKWIDSRYPEDQRVKD